VRTYQPCEDRPSSIWSHPTPEQLRDTGELDGVPLTTEEDVREAAQRRLAAIAQLAAGLRCKGRTRGMSRAVVLVSVKTRKRFTFESLTEACRFAGVEYCKMLARLRRGLNRCDRYEWHQPASTEGRRR
jgi:hypothetical protein